MSGYSQHIKNMKDNIFVQVTKHSGEKPYRSVNVKVTFQTIKFLSFSDKLAHLQTKMECLIICVIYSGFCKNINKSEFTALTLR